jgi:O-antigen/teichoic acid export membrane protein
VNVFLARQVPANEYGAFVTAYAVFLLLSAVQVAGVMEPMLIFGSGKYSTSFSHYFRVLLGFHRQSTLLLSGVLALVGLASWGAGSDFLAKAFVGLAVSGPFILLCWLARRACYPFSKPIWAATSGALYFALILAGLRLLHTYHLVSILAAVLVVGFAALSASLPLIRHLRGLTHKELSSSEVAQVLIDHWKYGRWSIATSLLFWVPSQSYFVSLSSLSGGLEASGALKALNNLISPIAQSDGALATLLTPVLVRSRSNPSRFRYLLRLAATFFAIEGIVYWIMLTTFRHELVLWLYDGRYSDNVELLWVYGLLPLLGGPLNVLGTALLALEQPDKVFWATFSSAVVTLTIGVAAVWLWGMFGAVVGMLVSELTQVTVMFWFLAERNFGGTSVWTSQQQQPVAR